MMGEIVTEINPDGNYESTPHLLPSSFASAYHERTFDMEDHYCPEKFGHSES